MRFLTHEATTSPSPPPPMMVSSGRPLIVCWRVCFPTLHAISLFTDRRLAVLRMDDGGGADDDDGRTV